jgi:hypothetical protein
MEVSESPLTKTKGLWMWGAMSCKKTSYRIRVDKDDGLISNHAPPLSFSSISSISGIFAYFHPL